MRIYSRVGVPREILSDQGSQFMSDLMKEVSRLLSIEHFTSSPYHPQCNGLVERFNGTLKQMLKKLSSSRPRDWDAVLFAYREVPQESLQFSPFELLYGRTVRGPMAILRELWTKEIPEAEVKTTYQYVVDLRERMEDSLQLARENLQMSATRQSSILTGRPRCEHWSRVAKRLYYSLRLTTSCRCNGKDRTKLLLEWDQPTTRWISMDASRSITSICCESSIRDKMSCLLALRC